MPYRLPTEQERQLLFLRLKAVSSLSAWRHCLALNSEFIEALREAFEATQSTPPPDGIPLFSVADFSLTLERRAAFEAAVERLSRGDRLCFRFALARGHFELGLTSHGWIASHYNAAYGGHTTFPLEEAAYWPNVLEKLNRVGEFASDLKVVLEQQDIYRAAPIGEPDFLVLDTPKFLNLKAVAPIPPPNRNVIVKTGATVPAFGIYEPVDIVLGRAFLRDVAKAPEKASSPPPAVGCMNYLTAGSRTPSIPFPEDSLNGWLGKPSAWRLLWKDERYLDGKIPAEEANYGIPVAD